MSKPSPNIIHGAPVEEADVDFTLASHLKKLIQEAPLRSYTEISSSGYSSSISIDRVWRRSQALCKRSENIKAADELVWVFCFSSPCDLIAAGWAAIAMNYKCYFWHIPPQLNNKIVEQEIGVLKKLFGSIQLVTSSALLRPLPALKSPKTIYLDRLQLSNQTQLHWLDRGEDTGTFFVKTSGTTGKAKMAKLPFAIQCNRLHILNSIKKNGDKSTRNSRTINWLPLDNITALNSLYPKAEVTVLLCPSYFTSNPLSLFKAIETNAITSLGVSSSTAAKLVNALNSTKKSYDLSSLINLGVGLEPISIEPIQKFTKILQQHNNKKLQITFGYGMTETGFIASSHSYTFQELLDLEPNTTISYKYPSLGLKIRISPNDLEEEYGEIEVLAPGRYLSGYIDALGELQPLDLNDGWLTSGDIGTIENGELIITGRKKSYIFVDGKNISLAGVEESLRTSQFIKNETLLGAFPDPDSKDSKVYNIFVSEPELNLVQQEELIKQIRALATKSTGIAPQFVFNLSEKEIAYTRTGKLDRVRTLNSQLHKSHHKASAIPKRKESATWNRPRQVLLAEAWAKILSLDYTPHPDDHFFEHGGTSFLAATYITEAEKILGIRIPLEKFFETPQMNFLWRVFINRKNIITPPVETSGYYLDRIKNYLEEWPGKIQYESSLLRGFNTDGTRPPLFWVFQLPGDMELLAQKLGPDQPLYGMRSLVHITAISSLNDQILDEVGSGYLNEILCITKGAAFHLGGNCQAAIVTLWMARKLNNLNCSPKTLFLMEWSFSWGLYTNKTVLLYGEQSFTKDIYESDDSRGQGWKTDFQDAHTAVISGAHGEYFEPENISSLVAQIKKFI